MGVTVAVIAAVGAWGLGFTPLPGSPVSANRADIAQLKLEVRGIKESIMCSSLKTDIERNREELYNIEREIEMAGDYATERQFARRNQLINTLRDNERRFDALGCYAVFQASLG